MTQEKTNKEEFAKINKRFDDLMVFLVENMATKADLKEVEERLDGRIDKVENEMKNGFASIKMELSDIYKKLDEIEKNLKSNFTSNREDI